MPPFTRVTVSAAFIGVHLGEGRGRREAVRRCLVHGSKDCCWVGVFCPAGMSVVWGVWIASPSAGARHDGKSLGLPIPSSIRRW